jgi:hypothetical protein
MNDSSEDKIKYEKLNVISKHTNNSLINELKTDLNNDNSSMRNSLNNNDKINYRIINSLNNEEVNNNSLEENNKNKEKVLHIGKEHFYKKLNINKLKEERKKIKVNKLNTLQDKPVSNNNNDNNVNLSERERYPKSIYITKTINNENIVNKDIKRLKFKLKELTEKKIFNNSLYSKKICLHNKSFSKPNNIYELNTNLSIYQITNRINKFCTDNKLFYQQTNQKYTVVIEQINTFVIEINTKEDRNILKFIHENGDENITKKYLINLYSEIAK